ncbi:MAG: hypothetical protein JST21_04970 [Bacteroidetes bacterium]|nr:hypothetical protein [Bacteroidota bacterium]
MFVPRANINNPAVFFAGDTYRPPIISFAGVQDPVFDIHQQPIYFSKNNVSQNLQICGVGPNYIQNFGIETNCLLTSSYATVQNNKGKLFNEYGIGSETIFHMFDDNSVFSELYLDCQMMHGLNKTEDVNCTVCGGNYSKLNQAGCPDCAYQSNFGVNVGTQSQTYDYIAGRAATFFQAIITSTTGIVHNKKFVEQENDRYGCNTPDNPTTFIPNNCDGDTHQ